MPKTLALALLLILCCCRPSPRPIDFKVIVLGFDGVDPDLIEQWIGSLSNIQRLSRSGTVCKLGTTNPPQSPVAWASFATGMNPGKHGIFDFLRRDPKTYFPDIGLVEQEKPKFLFDTIPIRGPKITNNRQGLTFWKHLDDAGIAATNLRLPLEFPAQELSHGQTLSGLGVPDVRGTWGTYFYLATDLTQWDLNDTEFGGRQVKLEMDGEKIRAELDGPVDPRREDFQRIQIPLELKLNQESTAVTIQLQGQEQTVQEGQWSDWFHFEFPIGPFVKVKGISRFYILETFPEVRLYLMPIGLDPVDPPVLISAPAQYAAGLVEQLGLYKTLGWMHETWGLNEEQISEGIFLEDLFRTMETLEKALLAEIGKGQSSLYTAVFTATDSVSHMFFRLIDPEHPRYDEELAQEHGDAIFRVYQKMDLIIGEVLDLLEEKDILLVVSDHGFHTWRKEFNTNTWLVRNGYMYLRGRETDPTLQKLDQMFSGGSFFPNVDWRKTRAYSLGLSHIYINLRGRESRGIVNPGEEYKQLVDEILSKIVQYQDPDTEELVLQNAYFRDDIYSGDQQGYAGDIQISFRTGYRTSWQTALGAIPENILVANLRKWSGDHCSSDISDTSGFFVSNRKIQASEPSILDIAPTLYRIFEVEIPSEVDGKPLTIF
ncbi:alkaline phosphatase family protein [Acidobacteria bacterium AH-259-G07]|nr:alkaline phosphatase family protein [Acidobacteria bacterium AH-259-G07]